jgi:cation-transporting ATPase I
LWNGTLTSGHIELKKISDAKSERSITNLNASHKFVLAAALCASPNSSEQPEELPHATDRAILAAGLKLGVTQDDFVSGWKQTEVLGFLPTRGYHAVIGKGSEKVSRIVVKGAPEIILPRCKYWLVDGGLQNIDKTRQTYLRKTAEKMAASGLRVLAVAQKKSSEDIDFNEKRVSELEFLGFLGLADSVRLTASEAIKQIKGAGVHVAMITGDHPETAKAIARELDILNGEKILTGAEIDTLTDGELKERVMQATVFARVTPIHKVRLIKAFQSIGKVVAMTGDGANDAGAIRLANTGIAVGRRASHAAIEAADLVITDDRLETIVDSIVEGRAMWSSVKDALAILVGGNLGEVLFTLNSTALSGQSALNTRQLLLVNLMTDMLPALTIALRPPQKRTPEDLINEGPDSLLGKDLFTQIVARALTTTGATSAAWLIGRFTGFKKRANTMALATLVTTQLSQTVVLGKGSFIVSLSALLSAGMLVAVIQLPGISNYFGCTPLDPVAWLVVGGSAVGATGLSVILPQAYKMIFLK